MFEDLQEIRDLFFCSRVCMVCKIVRKMAINTVHKA